jgi:hypothetical protein
MTQALATRAAMRVMSLWFSISATASMMALACGSAMSVRV